jgi:hypothetical protein
MALPPPRDTPNGLIQCLSLSAQCRSSIEYSNDSSPSPPNSGDDGCCLPSDADFVGVSAVTRCCLEDIVCQTQ